MILAVATLRVKPDMVEQYEAAVRDLLPKVKADEPGALVYEVGRSHDDPLTYRIVEIYRDQASIDGHMSSRFVEAAKPAMFACLDGEIEIRMHETL